MGRRGRHQQTLGRSASPRKQGCTDKNICPDSGTSHDGRQGSSVKELGESLHHMILRFLPDSHLSCMTHQAGLRISGSSPIPHGGYHLVSMETGPHSDHRLFQPALYANETNIYTQILSGTFPGPHPPNHTQLLTPLCSTSPNRSESNAA